MALPSGQKQARLMMLAAIAVVVAGLYFAKEVLVPIALAVLLSFLLSPLVARLQRWGMGRVPAVIIVTTLLCVAIAGLGWLVYSQVHDLAARMPQYQATIDEKAKWVSRFTREGEISRGVKKLKDTLESAATQPASQPTTQPVSGSTLTAQKDREPMAVAVTNFPGPAQGPLARIMALTGPLLEPLATAGLVIVFVIFMLIAREDLRDRLIRLIGQARINLTTQAMDDAAQRISKFLVATAIVNGTYGVAISLGLFLIGLLGGQVFPNFLLWGLLCAVLRFIPYLGPWIAAAFPIVVSMLAYQGMMVPALVIGMFIVVELVSNNFMEPMLYGSSTGVSALAIIVAAVFWTWLWGIAGLLLATPLTVLIVVMGKYVPQLEFLNVLLGDEPALAPKYRFYQRVLAEDEEEAQELLEEYLEEKPLPEVYDTVVVPALSMAENERHQDRLDERKQRAIRQSVRDMIEELGEKPAKANSEEGSSNGKPTLKYERCVLCLPARDEADEICAAMLAQLLVRDGYCAEYVSVSKLASEMIEMVESKGVQVVVISALPPAAVTHARYILKRLRGKFPELKIVVGLWNTSDTARAKKRLSVAGTDLVVRSLRDGQEQIRQLVEPLALAEREEAVGVS